MSNDFDILGAQRRVFESSLRSLEKLVALALIDFWPNVYPAVSLLEERTGLSRRAVFAALTTLRRLGAIVVTSNYPDTLSSRYDLRGMMALPAKEAHRCTTRTSAPCTLVQDTHPTGAPGAPAPVQVVHPKEPTEGTKEGTNTAAHVPGSPTKGAPKRKRERKPETALPADWQPTEAHRAYAEKHGLQLDLEADSFRGWAEGRTTVSWGGTFTTRLANQAKWNRERPTARACKPVVQRGGVVRESDSRWLDDDQGAAE